MKTVAVLLLAAAGLSAQTADMEATIRSLRTEPPNTVAQKLTREMLVLTPESSTVLNATVISFTAEFTRSLVLIPLTNVHVRALAQAMSDVMRSSGSTFRPASVLSETLSSAGLDTRIVRRITDAFMAIGHELRGPDDVPAR